ncbi:thioesterase II family protein [Streptomyces sp. GbtcB6]|uniref:thioesterase II family protein n=1 Tax=Streptomyces sp. GbtcB6 TaxID=2824751 RepID=UPI001C2F8177|nr:alpha/beta fold hydrolase [Streptomyces sp. GbtcB6]
MPTENTSDWLRRFTPLSGSSATLVCFPHAGGAASSFVPLSRALAPEVEVVAVQYPGRQDRRQDPPAESIEELADAVFGALGPELPRDCAFFGHSMGAVVAFEVARRYERRPDTAGPVRLFASARRAPSLRRDDRVHLRGDAGIIAELRRLSGTDQALLADEELMAMLLPALRADYRAIETYRLAPQDARIGCPITVLVGDADPVATIEDATAWRAHSTSDVDVRVLPGGHFYLDGQSDAVAREIRGALTPFPAGPGRA